jgi:hypothetical protein
MSALLNHNPRVKISWKGRTINQITSSIQKNGTKTNTSTSDVIFRAMPLKIYRREIATNIPTITTQNTCHNSRVSTSIDELNYPGGSILSKSATNPDSFGQLNTLESPAPGNLNETYGCKGANTSSNCAEKNARRRCRSSGIIRRVYDNARSEISYFTNTNQYLVSRSKTFLQNQYRHVRPNDISIVTTSMSPKNETYSPNGVSHNQKAYIAEGANVFYYYWIDASGATDFATNNPNNKRFTVTIPPGNYDVHELNSAFETVMTKNMHYFVYTPSQINVFLMKIIYNNTNCAVEIQSFSNASVSNQVNYLVPIGASWTRPAVDAVPVYYFPSTGIQNVVGFSSGYYPNVATTPTANQTLNGASYGALSNLSHTIYPSYSITYYKPSNRRFATQGGVSSGDMTQRVKYETISRNGLVYSNALGVNVGNAMSYGISYSVYTIKDKIGYPAKQTPVIDKYTGEMKRLANGRLTGKCASSPGGN